MNRRTFLVGSLTASLGQSFAAKPKPMKLAFSTLGCPDWSWGQILAYATKGGFSGIELRGLGADLDILMSPVFASSQLAQTRRQLKDAGIQVFNLGSSAHLHAHDPIVRVQQLDHARRYLDLAAALDCPYVRVFPDRLPAEYPKEATLEQIKSGLATLADHVHGSPTRVLLETHGDVVESQVLAKIMQEVHRPEVGLIWDPFNMWIKTNEEVSTMYRILRPWIHHVHLKDAKVTSSGFTYVPCGAGDFDLKQVVGLLQQDHYKGYYSLEWEKKWHPTIAPPEEVFPAFVAYMKRLS